MDASILAKCFDSFTKDFADSGQGWCQTNANQSLIAQIHEASGRKESAPLDKSDVTVYFEIRAGLEAAFRVEVV